MKGKEIFLSPNQATTSLDLPPHLSHLFKKIAQQGNGVIMTMGKGGVGKTFIATELALFLTQKGHNVLLATTDPAAHLDFTLGNTIQNLKVARIDPKEETKRYTEKIMSEAGKQLDVSGKELLEEDLARLVQKKLLYFMLLRN